MSWFEGSSIIAADTKRVASELDNYGEHCAAVLRCYPGITSAELLADGGDSIQVKTSEGVMRRTDIRKETSDDRVVIEFDEVYQAGPKMSASAHYRHEFVPSKTGSEHRLVISDVEAPGFLGWLYRSFGARNIGRGMLTAYSKHYGAPEASEKSG